MIRNVKKFQSVGLYSDKEMSFHQHEDELIIEDLCDGGFFHFDFSQAKAIRDHIDVIIEDIKSTAYGIIISPIGGIWWEVEPGLYAPADTYEGARTDHHHRPTDSCNRAWIENAYGIVAEGTRRKD